MSISFSDLTRAIIYIQNNSADIVNLLECGADVDVVDMQEATPLHWACALLRAAIVDSLLSHNADIDIVDNNGYTALHEAMSQPATFSNRVAVLQLMATCAQSRLEASSADWIRLAQNEYIKL